MTEQISSLSEILAGYDVILCDVWGVLHNGVVAFDEAGAALAAARKAGTKVVLLTNSPRRNDSVERQLDAIGVVPDAFDRIVTSGDVTLKLIADTGRPLYFLGPERDLSLLDGLDVPSVPADQAEVVLCTGFFDDESETPETYRAMLTGFIARGLPMICANPDLVVERGHRLIPCAGAIAEFYQQLGGKTLIAGKPHAPIYRQAMEVAGALHPGLDPARVIAIGDGMMTDVRGAVDHGLDLLYVSAGIHGRDYMRDGKTDEAALLAFLAKHAVDPRYWMPRLA